MIGGAGTRGAAWLRRARVRALAAALALMPAVAAAGPRDNAADVETAEQLYAKFDYDRASEQAERVLKQRGLTHDQLVRASRILAIASAMVGKEDFAREAFLQLLVYDPDATIDPTLAAKVSTPFAGARGQLRQLPSRPGLEVVSDVHAEGGQLRVTTHDPTKIAKKIVAGYRWTSSGEYTVGPVALGEGTVEIGAARAGRTRLDFYVQAFDDHDNAVFEAGNPQVPKSAFAEPTPLTVRGTRTRTRTTDESHPSIVASPLFWVITGVVVVGGATALFLALRPEDHPATTAVLSPVIRCGNDLCK